jgi:hypothetical protein
VGDHATHVVGRGGRHKPAVEGTYPTVCVPDVDDEAEMQSVQIHGVGLFEIGMNVDENSGKQEWSDSALVIP